jgi:hypothetical protein
MLGSYATGNEGHKVGDRVVYYRDDTLVGTIVLVEDNKLSCMVQWDGGSWWDFVWSNKIEKISHPDSGA